MKLQGLPKQDVRFPKLRNVPDPLSDDNDGKIIGNIDFKYLNNRASFMGYPVCMIQGSP